MTRTFDGRPLPAGLLDHLLDLARRAPSAGFSQGTHFLVLDGQALRRWWELTVDPAWRDQIAAGVGRAAAVVIPLADASAYTNRYRQADKATAGLVNEADWPVPYWLTDTAMATQNLLLLLEAHGIGALLYGLSRDAEQLAAFGVPDHIVGLGVVAVGYRQQGERPSGSPNAIARRPPSAVIHHAAW